MSNSTALLARIAMLGLIFGISSVLAGGPQTPLQVHVTPELRNGNPVLVFSVANTSDAAITINESALPWGNRYSVTVVVMPKRKEPLRGAFPIEDVFAETPITLRPGESRTGEVPLAWHVRDAQVQLRGKDLVVFWHYEPRGDEGHSLGEYGGWVALKVPGAQR